MEIKGKDKGKQNKTKKFRNNPEGIKEKEKFRREKIQR